MANKRYFSLKYYFCIDHPPIIINNMERALSLLRALQGGVGPHRFILLDYAIHTHIETPHWVSIWNCVWLLIKFKSWTSDSPKELVNCFHLISLHWTEGGGPNCLALPWAVPAVRSNRLVRHLQFRILPTTYHFLFFCFGSRKILMLKFGSSGKKFEKPWFNLN